MGSGYSYEFRDETPAEGKHEDNVAETRVDSVAETHVPSSAAGDTEATHLVVCCHGMDGTPADFRVLAKLLVRRYGSRGVVVYCPRENSFWAGKSRTHKGIDTCGERVANEVERVVSQRWPHVRRISFAGHSLGGLISRYTIGLLYERGFFDKVQPMLYTSFATPHVGSRRPRRGWYNEVSNLVTKTILSRTGRQLMLLDGRRRGKASSSCGPDTNSRRPPLLVRIAEPDSKFMRGLALFRHRSLYSNVKGDRLVPFSTAAILPLNPFRHARATPRPLSRYAHIVELDASADPVSAADAPGSGADLAAAGAAAAGLADGGAQARARGDVETRPPTIADELNVPDDRRAPPLPADSAGVDASSGKAEQAATSPAAPTPLMADADPLVAPTPEHAALSAKLAGTADLAAAAVGPESTTAAAPSIGDAKAPIAAAIGAGLSLLENAAFANAYANDSQKDYLRQILGNLRALQWDRFAVKIENNFSHVLIVSALPGVHAFRDVLEHYVDRFASYV